MARRRRRQNMLWKWCHFQTHFFHIKMLKVGWEVEIFRFSRKVQMHFPVSCYCFSSPVQIWLQEGEANIPSREYNFYVCHFNAGKERYLFFYVWHMKYIFNVSSWRKHAEMICCLFSLERDMKVHFFLNEAFFLYFLPSLISTSQTVFLPFLLETLPLFLLLHFFFWGKAKKVQNEIFHSRDTC